MNIEPIKLGPEKIWPFGGKGAKATGKMETKEKAIEINKETEAKDIKASEENEKVIQAVTKVKDNKKEIGKKADDGKEEMKYTDNNASEGKKLDQKSKARVNFVTPIEFVDVKGNRIETLNPVNDINPDVFRGGKLLGVSKLASLSFNMFLGRWKKFLGFFFIIAGVVIFFLLIYKAIPFLPIPAFYKEKITIALAAIFLIVFIVLKLIVEINIIKLFYNKNLSVLDIINNSKDKFLSFLAAEFLGIFIIIGILISYSIVIGIIYLPVLYFGPKLIAWSSAMISVVDALNWLFESFAVLSMLFLSSVLHTWISLAKYVVVLENMPPMQSIFYGHELIKKKVFSIMWMFFEIVAFVIIFLEIAMIHIPISESLAIFFYFLVIIFALLFFPVMGLFQFNIFENLKVIKKEEIQKNYDVRDESKVKMLIILGFLSIIFFICFVTFGKNYLVMYKKGIESGKIYNNFGSFERVELARKKENIINENINKVTKSEEEEEEEEEVEENKPELRTIEERDLKRKKDINAISILLYRYKFKKGSIPISPKAVKLNENNQVVSEIKLVVDEKIPLDPKDPAKYYEYSSIDGQTYELTANLENKGDSDCDPEIRDVCIYRIRK